MQKEVWGQRRREERQRRRREKRGADALLRQRSSDDRERRPGLTGYKPLKSEEPSFRETLRMENSRGILALGGDERKRPAIVVTEKSRSHEPAGGERERILQEKGEREYPAGQNRIIANPGERETGAVGFRLGSALTHTQVMGVMKRYMEGRDQRTLERMMPFMVTEKELDYKRKLEDALQRERREAHGPGQEKTVRTLDSLLSDKKEELIRKRQRETDFCRKLEKAMEEEKKTVWGRSGGLPTEMRRTVLPEVEILSDAAPDAGEGSLSDAPWDAGEAAEEKDSFLS